MKIRYDGLIYSFKESDSEILSKMHEEHHYCGMFDHKGLKRMHLKVQATLLLKCSAEYCRCRVGI